MMRRTLATLLLAPALALTACASDDFDDAAEEFRDGTAPAADVDPGPGNGDLGIYRGPNTDSSDCLVFEIMGGNVFAGGVQLLAVDDGIIVSADGEEMCHMEDRRLIDHNGDDVLFTVKGRWIFNGDVSFAGLRFYEKIHLFIETLEYTFKWDQVFDRFWWHGDVLITADDDIQWANDERKLLIAALIGGHCGSPGLPDDDTGHP